MSLYLDASVLLPLLVEEDATRAVSSLLAGADEPPLVGEFAVAEVASGLSRLGRMGVLTPEEASHRLAMFDVWRADDTEPCDIVAADVRLCGLFVRRFELKLRAPDALHLATVRRLGATLVTLARQLAEASRRLGVAVQIPDDDDRKTN